MPNNATPTPAFRAAYVEELTRAVADYPDEYPWAQSGRLDVQTVADRMFEAMSRGSYNKDSRAFKATCKRLGIAYTYAGIAAYCATVHA